MADLGLLTGVSEGFKQGLQNYQEQKQRNFNNRVLLADMMSKGFQTDQNGNITPGEGLLASQRAGLLKNQHDIGAYDPNSQQSQSANQLTTQALKASNPNATFKVPDGMSAADLNGENSITGKAITGGYAVQAGQIKALNIGTAMNDKNNIARDNQASAAVDKVVNDPQLKSHTQRVQGANRIQQQLDDIKQGKIVDTNQFLGDLNTEYVNLLTGSNNAALGKLERTEYRSAAGDLAGLIQKIKGSPQSINSPEILQQLETSVAGLKQTYQKNIDSRAQQLQRSYKHNPDATAAQKQAIQDMINTNGTGGNNQGLLGQPAPQPAQDPKISDYAQKNGLDYAHAQTILGNRGYKPNVQ